VIEKKKFLSRIGSAFPGQSKLATNSSMLFHQKPPIIMILDVDSNKIGSVHTVLRSEFDYYFGKQKDSVYDTKVILARTRKRVEIETRGILYYF
jgi:hypothetical protein